MCDGDSGGPFFNMDGLLDGITSFCSGCRTDNFSDDFARVSCFHDWIQAMICEESSVPPFPQIARPPTPSPINAVMAQLLRTQFDFHAHKIIFSISYQASGKILYAGPHYVASQGD
mmetsp:Transcript_2119/g.4616  ORF Transcript_2119/g.4616 Transcript_2119/m.4616 type:complete len:116 (-) Transcript_2119:266-613(-)